MKGLGLFLFILFILYMWLMNGGMERGAKSSFWIDENSITRPIR